MKKTDTTSIKPLRVPCLRGVDRPLRAARLRAARLYAPGSMPRHGILLGQWDAGSVVSGQKRSEDHD